MLLTASICEYFVVAGGRFKTTIKVDMTAIENNRYRLTYTMSFAQNTNYTPTQTIHQEHHFIKQDGTCCVPLITLDTDDGNVLTEATVGTTFMNGCIAITRHFLEHCHNTHHGFTKWVVQPATGRFYLVPDAELTHTPSASSPPRLRTSCQRPTSLPPTETTLNPPQSTTTLDAHFSASHLPTLSHSTPFNTATCGYSLMQ
jgi:hypothetical protein